MRPAHRFSLIVLAVLVFSSSLMAQSFRLWTPEDGVPIRQGYHIEWFRSLSSDDDGNFCMVWSDTRQGERDLWAQVVDSEGNALWADEGIVVSEEFSRQEDPHVMPDGQGNWIITWIDYRYDINIEDKGDVFIQKLDSEGNPLWTPEGGVPLCVEDAKQLWVQSFSDGNGGAVSIWMDGRAGNTDIYAQHTDADGNVQWEENGLMIAGGVGEQGSVGSGKYTADTDGNGGIIFGWVDNRDPVNINLYANRVNSAGDLVWTEDITGMPICTAEREQRRIRFCPDGLGGGFFTWEDKRLDIGAGDLYTQHVNAEGDLSWAEDGVVLCAENSGQEAPRIVHSAEGEAIVVWEDKRLDNVTYDLYTQRIGLGDGQPIFHWGTGTSGHVLCDFPGDQRSARLTPDNEGGAIYTWLDERVAPSPNNELYGERLDQNGDPAWSSEGGGIIVSDAPNLQDGNIVRALDANTISTVWIDYRVGSPGIYYQLNDFAGDELGPHNGTEIVYGIDNNGVNPTVTDAGDGDYYLSWLDGRFGNLGAYPYAQKINSSNGEVYWQANGINLTPGFPDTEEDLVATANKLQSVAASDGGLISVWQDNRDPSVVLLFAQKIDDQGQVLWGDMGVDVAYNPDQVIQRDQQGANIVPDMDGGVYVVFRQPNESWYENIKVQHLDANGNKLWNDPDDAGRFITNVEFDHEIEAVTNFEDGTLLVVYQRNDGEGEDDRDLYAIRLDQEGELAWEQPAVLSSAPELQLNAVTTHTNDGIVIAWEDQRRGSPILDIYGQMIHEDGTLSWQEGGELLLEADNQQSELAIGNDDTSFWLAWKDSRDGVTEDIYAQRYDLDGQPLLQPDTGIMVTADDRRQERPKIVVEYNGYANLAWEESNEIAYSDLFFTHLDADGEVTDPAYGTDGLELSNAYHRQNGINLALLPSETQGFVAVWQDNRSTGKEEIVNVYAQAVNDGTNNVGEKSAVSPERWELNAAYPNPFNPTTQISFRVGTTGHVELAVYDVLGRQVARLVNRQLNAGHHHVQWDGRSEGGLSVSSGIYFYRLQSGDVNLTRKMMLLK